jgi:hypothetical protein
VGPLERWLKHNIHFDLDRESLASLRHFCEKAAAMGLIPCIRPLEFPGRVLTAVVQR